MSYSLNLNKLLKDLSSPHRREALNDEVRKIKSEIEKLSKQVRPQAEAQVKKLEVRYKNLLSVLASAQKELDREVKKTMTLVHKTKKEAEKNLGNYKKLAMKQKSKIQSAFTTKKKVTNARAKRTTKKSV
jgi:hypothetical protein